MEDESPLIEEALTADLCDLHESSLFVCTTPFLNFGGRQRFSGTIRTVRVDQDNGLVRRLLAEPHHGSVLVVDGGGTTACALVGEVLATSAIENGWNGIIVNGAVRDTAALKRLDIGIKALAACPRPPRRGGAGEIDRVLAFGEAVFAPASRVVGDEDGLVVLP